MTRRKWWITGAIGLIAILGATIAGVAVIHRPISDCAVVRSMIDYNEQFNQHVNKKSEDQTETPESDYAQWSERLRGFADQIHDNPDLAEKTDAIADLAGQYAVLVPKFRAESSARSPLETNPSPSDAELSRIAKEFDDNLVALDNACPA